MREEGLYRFLSLRMIFALLPDLPDALDFKQRRFDFILRLSRWQATSTSWTPI
jgi:hypothetical protein